MDIVCRHDGCAAIFPTYEDRTEHEISEHYDNNVSIYKLKVCIMTII